MRRDVLPWVMLAVVAVVVVAAVLFVVKLSGPGPDIVVEADPPTTTISSGTTTPLPPPPAIKPPSRPAQSYTVKPGDTLWDISREFSGDPTWFKDIVTASWVKNPGLIYVGQVLTIPAIP